MVLEFKENMKGENDVVKGQESEFIFGKANSLFL